MGFEEINYHFKEDLAYTEDEVLVYNIFVYNIPEKATQEETMAYFSQFGQINKVRLVEPKVGFIHFENAADAANVLKQTRLHTLNSKRIYVRACESWLQPHKLESANDDDNTDDDEMPPASGNSFNLAMLNEDCLEQIVKKLELKDQVRFSLTCQRFKDIFEMVCKTEHKIHRVENLDRLTLWEIREFFMTAGPNIKRLIGTVPFKDCERIIKFISKFCPNIKSIFFDSSYLSSTVLKKLFEKLEHCSVVELRDCSLHDDDILLLKKLPNLESLSVAQNGELTGKHIELLITVKTLILYGCGNIQPTHFVEMCKSLKDLQSFDVQRCERFTEFALTEMVQNCHKLESLKISCPMMPYESVAHLPCLKNLELLSSSTNTPLRPQLFQELAEHKSNQLESLKIVAKNCITSERANLIACLTNLKHLTCANNENLTDDCLHKFAELKNLEEIELKNCRAITNEGLLQLIRRCTKLKKVNIQLCNRITDQFVFKVIEVLNSTQNQRGKKPCVFQVARSGISSDMISHADYLAAISLLKLSFVFDSEDPFDNSDFGLNDYNGHFLLDEIDDFGLNDDNDYDGDYISDEIDDDYDDVDYDDNYNNQCDEIDDDYYDNYQRDEIVDDNDDVDYDGNYQWDDIIDDVDYDLDYQCDEIEIYDYNYECDEIDDAVYDELDYLNL